MKYVRGSTSASARRNCGNECGEKNAPEMNAIGRYTALTVADAPSAERTAAVMPRPSAAKAAAPSASARTSESQRVGSGTEKRMRPIAIMQAQLTAKAISVAASTAARHAHAG